MFAINKNLVLVSALLLISNFSAVKCQNWLIDYLLPEDYNSQVPPIEDDNVLVNASISMFTFRIVNGEQNFRTNMTLCMWWNDHRIKSLNFTNETVPWGNNTEFAGLYYPQVKLTKLDRIWYPEVYFRNSVSSELIHSLRVVRFLDVYPDTKLVRMCSRMQVTFLCLLNLSNFPFDENHCYFELENVRRLRLNMESIHTPDGNSQVRVMHRFVGTCDPMGLDTFTSSRQRASSVFNNQSCTYGAIRFVRHVNYYVIRYYTNSFFCMSISCLGPWLPTNAWPARTILAATVLLTQITISITGYNEVPARDIVSLYWWFWGCQFFIYMALCEYAMALAWVQFVFEKKIAHAKNIDSPDGHYFGKRGWYLKMGNRIEGCLHRIFGPIDFFFDPQGRNKVDYVGRLVLPCTMLLFVFVYICCTLSPWGTIYRYY